MRTIFFILLSLLMLAGTTLSLLAGEKEWYSFREGMEVARNQQKHIIIDFYADWCTWCKVMEEKTFSDPEVEVLLFKHFAPIKLEAENTRQRLEFRGKSFTPRQLTAAFRVSGFPSIAFLSPQQELITVIPGYIEKEMFINLLQYMLKECYKSQTTFEEFLKRGCDDQTTNK